MTKACIKCGLEKPRTEFYRAVGGRDGLRTECKACAREIARAWARENRERSRENSKLWRRNTPDYVKRNAAAVGKWREQNKERWVSHAMKWNKAHPEAKRNGIKTYRQKHYARVLSWNARRRAGKLRAVLPWGEWNDFALGECYDLARRRGLCIGLKWHVDHVVPLRSKFVCGLHVWTNVQVIPGAENGRKSNKRWPDMP